MNQKGQAAITDALIFLAIVGVISALLITEGMEYGLGLIDDAQGSYERTYINSSLKTLYSITYGRDGLHPLTSEVNDYLITMVKEDYGIHSSLRDETKLALMKTMDNVFAIFPNKSYMILFYITYKEGTLTRSEPLFMGLKTTYFEGERIRPIYLTCASPEGLNSVANYLAEHNINQKVAESKLVLYKDLLESDKVQKVDGTTYLVFWNAVPDLESNPGDNATGLLTDYGLDCNVINVYEE
jgi:hypothetical protein